jgi:hypothetical protein
MRKVSLIAAALVALALPAYAADKGPPASLDQIMSLPDRKAVSCYLETSVAGIFLRTDREASAGIGGGCDAHVANLIIGAGIRADFADWRDAGSIYARLGLALNAGAIIYGVAEWRMPDWRPQDIGQLAIGGGVELKLEPINPNLWLFSEGTYAAETWGKAPADDITGRIGLRFKF